MEIYDFHWGCCLKICMRMVSPTSEYMNREETSLNCLFEDALNKEQEESQEKTHNCPQTC